MPDLCNGPTLVLTALFLPAFGYLFLRYRNVRTLLWFLGFFLALVSSVLLYAEFPGQRISSPWAIAWGESALLVCTALFMASLSPLSFRLGPFKVLYAIPYFLPLVVYSILSYGVYPGGIPYGGFDFVFLAVAAVSFCASAAWCLRKGSLPVALSLGICLGASAVCVLARYTMGGCWALRAAESFNLLMTALLIVFEYRRFSPGMFLSLLGFLAWSLHGVDQLPFLVADPCAVLILARIDAMSKVLAAVGMIFLSLEDELNFNVAARERERRASGELAAYSGLILSRRRVEDFDRLSDEICQKVVEQSRFRQAALIFDRGGRFHWAGSAGMSAEVADALRAVVERIAAGDFPAPGAAPLAVEQSRTIYLDLSPWTLPEEDLRAVFPDGVFAIPMRGRTDAEGVILLSGIRPVDKNPEFDRLRPDDLLPIELLAARLEAARNHVKTLEKLIDTERFAGVGQLTASVVQNLRDPLTVILGYATLLEESEALKVGDRFGARAILGEARRMNATLDSLSRVSSPYSDRDAAVSVAMLFADLEQLCQKEFHQRRIEFKTSIPSSLPRVLCSEQQLCEAIVNCLHFCFAAMQEDTTGSAAEAPRVISVGACDEGGRVRITIAHSGRGFAHPERAFDPFTPALEDDETAGLPLSLCATLLRDNNGGVAARNLAPCGAEITLELQVA